MTTQRKTILLYLKYILLLILINGFNYCFAKNAKELLNPQEKIINEKELIKRCESSGCKLQIIKSKYFKKEKVFKATENNSNCFFLGAITIVNGEVFLFSNAFENFHSLEQLNRLIKLEINPKFKFEEAVKLVQELCTLSDRYMLVTKNDMIMPIEFFFRTENKIIKVDSVDFSQRDSMIYVARQIETNLDQILINDSKKQSNSQKMLLRAIKINIQNDHPIFSSIDIQIKQRK